MRLFERMSNASGSLDGWRAAAAGILFIFFAVQAAIVSTATAMLGLEWQVVLSAMLIIGAVTLRAVWIAPDKLQTRYLLSAALHSTWMFGLYAVKDLNNGAHMLEVHMLYFVNCVFIAGFACWRSAVFSTTSVLAHHLILTLLLPTFIWAVEAYAWTHFWTHALIGVINMVGGAVLAVAIEATIEDLEHKSTQDALTGLRNRRALRGDVAAMLKRSDDVAIAQFDLDGFKRINDTAGHAVGDGLIVEVARALERTAPANAIVARLGGDEFAVAASPASALQSCVEQILDWSRSPVDVDGFNCRFGVSVGIACAKDGGHTVDGLLQNADVALYSAKARGKNCWVSFTREMGQEINDAQELASDILRGLQADEFEPFFQTQHDATTGEIVGVEVLSRWLHPTRGLLPPSAFLKVATEIGRMAEIDSRILEKAIAVVRQLEENDLCVRNLSVNISFGRLRDPSLLAAAREAQDMSAALNFELVEAIFLDNVDDLDRWTLDQLREYGVGIELDDFGTGHASIVALMRISPDRIKIDRALIAPIAIHPSSARVLEAIIDLAQALDIGIVAEGVETQAQADLLRGMGVQTLQGFLFSNAISATALAARLADAEKQRVA